MNVLNLLCVGGLLAVVLGFVSHLLRMMWMKARHGWFVKSLGDGEGGVLVYVENGRELHLHLDTAASIVYVPTDQQWMQRVPGWAQHRKDEILLRIQSQFG